MAAGNPGSGKNIEPGQWALVAASCIACALVANRFAGLVEAKRTVEAGISYACQHLLDLSCGLVFSTSSLGLAVTIVAAVLPGVAFMNYYTKGTYRRGEEHGSARFATLKEMRAFMDRKVPMGNVLLSRDAGLSYLRPSSFECERNRNVLVVGGSGAGKTRGYVKPNLMQIPSPENCPKGMSMDELEKRARSFVVTDPKGTTRMETGQALAENGYDIKEFNVVDWSSCMHFNPLAYLKDEADVQSFVTCFIRNTTPKDASSAEPFWENSERKLYEAVINYMIECLPPEQRNLPMMCALLDMAKYDERNPGMSGLDVLFYELETGREYNPGAVKKVGGSDFSMWGAGAGDAEEVWKKVRDPKPESPAVRAYRDVMSGAPETIQSILISVKVRLGRLRPEAVSEKLEYDELELDRFGDRKMVLYLVPHDQDDTYNFLIAMVIWLQLKLLSDRAFKRYGGKLPKGVDFILDEAGNFYIPQLDNTVATCRSRNIGVSIILQSNAQLKSRYGDDAPTIVDCCDTLVFLGGKSQDTTKQLEEIIGQQTVTTDNAGESKGAQHSMSKTIAQHGRPLMQSSEIAHMSRSDCLVLITSAYPWIGPKYDISKHPMYAHVDPGHDKDDPNCPRHAFDTAAYLEDPTYFDQPDAKLSIESSFDALVDVEGGDALTLVELTLSVSNAESAEAAPVGPALNFGGEVRIEIEPVAVPGAGADDVSKMLRRGPSGGGIAWQQQPARYSVDGCPTARIDLNRFSGRQVICGWRLEPGARARAVLEMASGASGNKSIEELLEGAPEGGVFGLRCRAEIELHCATCDVECFDVAQDFKVTLAKERKDADGRFSPRCVFEKVGSLEAAATGSWGHVEREEAADSELGAAFARKGTRTKGVRKHKPSSGK